MQGVPSAPFKCVIEGLQEYTPVSLNQVILGILDLVPQPPSDNIALCNGILHQEAHLLVLESASDPVLKHVIVWVQVGNQGFHTHVDFHVLLHPPSH